ncbi:MAG: hypothetical protein ACRDRK_05090 [Pseudonocardia sp.]
MRVLGRVIQQRLRCGRHRRARGQRQHELIGGPPPVGLLRQLWWRLIAGGRDTRQARRREVRSTVAHRRAVPPADRPREGARRGRCTLGWTRDGPHRTP